MAEAIDELRGRLAAATVPGFRERLLDRGLARGLVWRDGVLPPDAPRFAQGLTEDLLDYAHAVLAAALRLRTHVRRDSVLDRAFLVAGEAIEAAVHRGEPDRLDRGFQRVSAAVAFHLGRYAARAYSMLPNTALSENLAPTERALVFLLRRALDEMQALAVSWVLDGAHQDESVARRLLDDADFDESDAIDHVLTTSFMRGLAAFDHAICTGAEASATEARRLLLATADAALHANAVTHWWTSTLAWHLLDELWALSLHKQIPGLPPGHEDRETWSSLRRDYVDRLRLGKRAAIELWPSQLEAAQRAVDATDDLVVALPTSAGKTRIAELCILRTMAAGKRVVYITPLRALSAQVERDLDETFAPLGFSASVLYGAAGVESGDAETLREDKVVVATPEKLDFALRNDPSILDDVGLVVLDEGHMLGPSEREVRYEALVQRLLRRPDAAARRLVCLSALFPDPAQMADLVAWIRQDEPGAAVHSTWRPTRQRFGVLRWWSDAARLDVQIEGESPFISRFVEARDPPPGSRRRRRFPDDKNELTLAAAWRFVEQQKAVLIYCSLRRSVETLGKLVLKCIAHRVLEPLRAPSRRVQDAMAAGAEWLGADHPAVQCLQHGIALHHGGLPRPFLTEVERVLRSGDCPVTIASPTLAQGLNLSASVLLVPSIWRNRQPIPPAEFANVAGRAGRAFVDVEGLVLHVVQEDDRRHGDWAVGQWEALVGRATAPAVESGLLVLTWQVCNRISTSTGIPLPEVVDYVAGNSAAWDFRPPSSGELDVGPAEWERDIASLDAAILALLDADADVFRLAEQLESVLHGSLFARQLARVDGSAQLVIRGLLEARARRIWNASTADQRRGYHVAGVGLRAGRFLDAHVDVLVDLLLAAEGGLAVGDAADAIVAIVDFARLVFQTPPFRSPRDLPADWQGALRSWLEGRPASVVVAIGAPDGVDLLQDALAYRLPWAMEAVRVYAKALGRADANLIGGAAAMAVEAGSTSQPVITLLRGGLSSREAALAAVATTAATFMDRTGMTQWLSSPEVETLSQQEDWPTAQSRHAWLEFAEGGRTGRQRTWLRLTQRIKVDWLGSVPSPGTYVVLEPGDALGGGTVLTPDLVRLGAFRSALRRPHRTIVSAKVGDASGTVVVEYFGPRVMRGG